MSFNTKSQFSFNKLNLLLLFIIIGLSGSAFQCSFFPPTNRNTSSNSAGKDGKGWRVWVRTEPCSGRFDWLSVAKDPNTGGGKNFYVPYESVLPKESCTEAEPFGCTFAEANALMEKLRPHPKFLSYCCRDYSVWENSMTGKKSIVVGKFGTGGPGFQIVKGNLCCEEAEELSGIKGACSGTQTSGAGYHTQENIDRPGGDYRDFDLSSPDINLCSQACDGDPNCKSFSYVKPGVQKASARCWLKNIVPQPITSTCCISGVKSSSGITVHRTPKTPGGGDDYGANNDDRTYPNTPLPTQPPPTPNQSGRWELVSTTVTPATASNGYSYNAQSSSAELLVYNGDKHNFQWTKPPQSFDENGFTVTLNVQCQSQPNNRCASTFGVAGDGLETDTPSDKRSANAYGENGAIGRGNATVTFKPPANANEITVRIVLMWSAVQFHYKYRRV